MSRLMIPGAGFALTSWGSLALLSSGLFAALSLLCLCVFLAVRGQRAIAWLSGALLCGALETAVLALLRGTGLEQAGTIILVPLAHLCFARAVRLATGTGGYDWRLSGLVLGLSAASLVLLAARLAGLQASVMVQLMPFELGCVLALCDAGTRLWRCEQRHLVDLVLAVLVAVKAAMFLSRLVLLPLLFPINVSAAVLCASGVERTLSALTGILTPPAVFLLLARVIGGQMAEYRHRAERDGLTGLYNRETFEHLAMENAQWPGAIAICDIDRFKAVNDRFGHFAGDSVIRAFADLLQTTRLPVARVGGEEFALLLPGRTPEAAATFCETLRRTFAHEHHPELPDAEKVTASFGIATIRGPADLEPAWRAADIALYRAKRLGRDRVCIEPACAGVPDLRQAARGSAA